MHKTFSLGQLRKHASCHVWRECSLKPSIELLQSTKHAHVINVNRSRGYRGKYAVTADEFGVQRHLPVDNKEDVLPGTVSRSSTVLEEHDHGRHGSSIDQHWRTPRTHHNFLQKLSWPWREIFSLLSRAIGTGMNH